MKRSLHFLFLFIFVFQLNTENNEEYGKDEWSDLIDLPYQEKVNSIDEKESFLEPIKDDEEKINKHSKDIRPNYLSKMYIESILKFNISKLKKETFNWHGIINSYFASHYYEAFLSIKKSEHDKKEKQIFPIIGSLRFSPFLMYYPKNKLRPLLSFYAGTFTTPISFYHATNPNISFITPTSKRAFFPSLNAIKISKKGNDLGTAIELSLPFLNFYFYWKDTKLGNQFNVYLAYRNETLNILNNARKAKINLAFLFRLLEINKEKNRKNVYLQIYGLNFNFFSNFFYINIFSFLSIFPKKIPDIYSTSLKSEMGFAYKFFDINFGLSHEGSKYIGKQNYNLSIDKNSKQAFYVQGKFKYKIFSTALIYYISKNNKQIQHNFGIFYSIGNTKIKYKNELLLKDNIYKLRASFSLKPNLNYFSFFNISSFLYLQEKKINTHIIKQYEVASNIHLKFGINFILSFANGIYGKIVPNKLEKKFAFFSSTTLFLIFKQEKIKEKGAINLKYDSAEKNFSISFKLTVEY